MSTKSPTERPIKKIIVSVMHKGKLCWSLVTARKVGNKYVVSSDAVIQLANKAVRGDTLTIG